MTTTQAPAPGVPAPAAPNAQGETSNDIMRWTKDDYRREMDRKAAVPHDPWDIRNRPFHKAIRQQAEARLRDVRVLLGPQEK
jgi:hypothetical protein